jgi:transposase
MSLQQRAEQIADLYQPPDGAGRPSGIANPVPVQEFLEYLAHGHYVEVAAELAGFSKRTIYNWLERGKAGEPEYAAFLHAVKAAEAKAEHELLSNVRKASKLPQFWAAGMTILERRHPERWGKRSDDSSGPKVVVQVGIRDSDVQITLGPSPDPAP